MEQVTAMTDPTEDAEALLRTVEKVRVERYPDLDVTLVNEILAAQIRNSEDRAEARRQTERIVTQWAAASAAKESGN
ncbi:hypothetical protein [Cellulomonas soli]